MNTGYVGVNAVKGQKYSTERAVNWLHVPRDIVELYVDSAASAYCLVV